MRRTRSFDHTPESVPAARRFSREVLHAAPSEAREMVELMVSELASNCIRHTDSAFDLTISHTRDEIRVEATDRGAGEPRMRTPGPTDPNGRGLQIIDMLAAAWGVQRTSGHGKTVWLTVTLRAPARVETAAV